MLIALTHIILQLGLCNAIASAAPDVTVSVNVQLLYPNGHGKFDSQLDSVLSFERGTKLQRTIEFDVPRGVYRMLLSAPKYRCSAADYIDVLGDGARTVAETLADGPPPAPVPVTLVEGTFPASFLYSKPTFALFDASLKCGDPVGTPLPSHIVSEYDPGSFYLWIYQDGTNGVQTPALVTLRLRSPTGLYHYVKLPMDFPLPWGGFPSNTHFNIDEDTVAGTATEKTDTLLCPKIYKTEVH